MGTVLSIWDAAALDAVGADAEVVPTFVNLTDASIKMVRVFVISIRYTVNHITPDRITTHEWPARTILAKRAEHIYRRQQPLPPSLQLSPFAHTVDCGN